MTREPPIYECPDCLAGRSQPHAADCAQVVNTSLEMQLKEARAEIERLNRYTERLRANAERDANEIERLRLQMKNAKDERERVQREMSIELADWQASSEEYRLDAEAKDARIERLGERPR